MADPVIAPIKGPLIDSMLSPGPSSLINPMLNPSLMSSIGLGPSIAPVLLATVTVKTQPTTTYTAPKHSPPSAVIVSSTLAGLFFLLFLALLLAWYKLWRERKLHMAPKTFTPELPNNQTGDVHPHDDTLNDQRHEFPTQQMVHAQELPLSRSNSRQELPLNIRSSAREV